METEQVLRRRIATVSDLAAIVRTMKALSAVSGRQCEQVLQALDAYSRNIERGLQVAFHEQPLPAASGQSDTAAPGLVILGSDVGLCGRFNETLVDCAQDKLTAATQILAVGSRIETRLQALGVSVQATLPAASTPAGLQDTVNQILTQVQTWQAAGQQAVSLVYSQQGTAQCQALLPVDFTELQGLSRQPWPSKVLPTFSLARARLLQALLHQQLFVRLYRACAQSLAAEHQLRLQAMQAAEQNIQDRLTQLQIVFRNQRQDAIDAELLDIGAGFQAAGGDKT